MEILPLNEEFLESAAELFVGKFKLQRQAVPLLPGGMEDPAQTTARLRIRIQSQMGLAAVDQGQLMGFMSWYIVENFRNAGRRGAYVPVWGHAVTAGNMPAVYAALYRSAAANWTQAGCQVHCISLLTYDQDALKTWFWSGFGMLLLDAIRSIQPLDAPVSTRLAIRKAEIADAEMLAVLEAEHWRHYAAPPILMAATIEPTTADGFRDFVQQPNNSVWLAHDGAGAAGFMRFEGQSFGATEIVQSETTIAITGAYTRPALRGLGAATALLDAALKDYTARGFTRCSVDFESFNPEAARFWPKYFDPVVYSLMRRPETL